MAVQMELPYVSSGNDLVGVPDFWKSRTNVEDAWSLSSQVKVDNIEKHPDIFTQVALL